MTQPIDVAYVEVVAQTKDFRKELKDNVQKDLRDTEKTAVDVGKNIEKAFKDAGEGASKAFRDSNGRLRDEKGRFTALGKAGEEAGDAVGAAFETATGAARTFSGTVLGLVSGIGQLASTGPVGLAVIAAAFVALAGAAAIAAAVVQNFISIAVFGIGLLPGILAGAVAGFGILAAAISGVSEAFQEESEASSGAAGAAVDNSRRIADAQRGVLQAQKELIKAREEERERIQDINRELIAARTAEKRATQNVLDAEYALQQARKQGDTRNIAEAQLRLEEANATLDQAKDKTEDLATEKAKADKNGVEGSERVQRALEALRDAQDALAAAQQSFSAGAAGQKRAIDSLSESAQAFVRALIAAKNELKPLQLAIQEAFFAGTAPLIDPIVENIKEAEPEILRVADAFNAIFKEILTFLGSDEAGSALEGVLGGLASFLEEITPAITPLLEAFGSLAGDSEDFGKIIGGVVKDGLLALADFVKNVDLKQLFSDAKEAINELLPLIGPTISILKSLFNIFASIGQIALPPLAVALYAVSGAFSFFEEVIVLIFTKIEDFIKLIREDPKAAFEVFKQAVKDSIQFAVDQFDNLLNNVSDTIDNIIQWIADLPKNIAKLAPKMLQAGKDLIKAFFEGLGAAGGFLSDVGKQVANSIIGFINRSVISKFNTALDVLQEKLNSVLPGFLEVDFPRLPQIPQLEQGGLITRDSIFRGGEKGKPEAVLPLTNSAAMSKIAGAIADAGGGGGGPTFGPGSVVVNFQGVVPTQAEAFRTGQAVGAGVADALSRRNINVAVRTM